MTMEEFEERLKRWAIDKGASQVEKEDLRFAIHEVTHARRLGLGEGAWSSDDIHGGIMELEPADKMQEEILARAVEAIALEHFGLRYDLEGWTAIALIEATRNGVFCDFDEFKRAVERAQRSPRTRAIFEEIILEVEEAHG